MANVGGFMDMDLKVTELAMLDDASLEKIAEAYGTLASRYKENLAKALAEIDLRKNFKDLERKWVNFDPR